MIQHTSARQHGGPAMLHQAAGDTPEHWGQWSGRRHYSLEVVQHPLRARMCGFGDKDRRPLAPAAVAKMIVKREDDTLVDVEDVDCSFFLVTVDLWSGDGKHEMNLVLHPSSTERYVPAHTNKSRRRGTSTSAANPRSSGNLTPASRSTPTPSQYRREQSAGATTPMLPPQVPTYSTQNYFSQAPSVSDPVNFPSTNQYGASTSDAAPTWGYASQAPPLDRTTSYVPPALPSIHSFGRPNTASAETWRGDGDLPYRAWTTDAAYPPLDNITTPQVDPALRAPSNPDNHENSAWSHQPDNSQGRYPQESYSQPTSSSQVDNSMYPPTPYAPNSSQTPYYPANYTQYAHNAPQSIPAPPTTPAAPLPRHTYTRTLVGPLSSNACRLLDEHRKLGIFFLFQDLSIRTEGTFRLRLRLMNVGAPPAPEAGAIGVHNDVSPVLAQTFTEPFVVHSAKRFPGVPDTTALSIAFGSQGQKLPLRNRHGSGKRRRRDDSGSDDSDGS